MVDYFTNLKYKIFAKFQDGLATFWTYSPFISFKRARKYEIQTASNKKKLTLRKCSDVSMCVPDVWLEHSGCVGTLDGLIHVGIRTH